MTFVALPMIWPNLRTGSPAAIGWIATLWPRVIGSLAFTLKPTGSPAAMSRMATTTGSDALSRRVAGRSRTSVIVTSDARNGGESSRMIALLSRPAHGRCAAIRYVVLQGNNGRIASHAHRSRSANLAAEGPGTRLPCRPLLGAGDAARPQRCVSGRRGGD